MTRLTRKVNYDGIHYGSPNGILCDNLEHLEKVYTKLGQLEDMEEELGIDLITYIKAIRQQKVWVLYNGKLLQPDLVFWSSHTFNKLCLWFIKDDRHIKVSYEDYGKTWALTREELE